MEASHDGADYDRPPSIVFVRGLDQSKEEPPSESLRECLRGLVAAAARKGRFISRAAPESDTRQYGVLKWKEGEARCEAPVYEVDYATILRTMWRRRSLFSRAIVSARFASSAIVRGWKYGRPYRKKGLVARDFHRRFAEDLASSEISDFCSATSQRTTAFFWYSVLFLVQMLLAASAAAGILLAPLMSLLFRLSSAWLTIPVALALLTVLFRDKLWLYANVIVPAGLYISRSYARREIAAEYQSIYAEASAQNRPVVLIGFSLGALVAVRSHPDQTKPMTFLCVGAPIAFIGVLFEEGAANAFECQVNARDWAWRNFFDRTDLCGSQVLDGSKNQQVSETSYPVKKEWQKLLWHHEAHNSYWYHREFTDEFCNAIFAHRSKE